MPTVKNKKTGLTVAVNDGHFSLNHPDYEVVKEKPKRKPRTKKPAAKKD